jgi:tol-pal system protein YbgF
MKKKIRFSGRFSGEETNTMMGAIRLTFVCLMAVSFLGCSAMLEPPSDIQRSVDYLRQDIQKLAKEQEALSKKLDELSVKPALAAAQPSVLQPQDAEPLKVEEAAARPAAEDPGNLSQDPGAIYNKAMDFMKNGRADEAERAFADFIVKFPQSDLADNAQYWIGECFYSQKKFQEAKEGFSAVLEHFPFGNKVPDAIYKAALCAGELGSKEERVSLLKQLVENYPYSDASQKAESLLSAIEKSSGQ